MQDLNYKQENNGLQNEEIKYFCMFIFYLSSISTPANIICSKLIDIA